MQVARFWKEHIDTVENDWNYVDYVDRRELMWVTDEISERLEEENDNA